MEEDGDRQDRVATPTGSWFVGLHWTLAALCSIANIVQRCARIRVERQKREQPGSSQGWQESWPSAPPSRILCTITYSLSHGNIGQGLLQAGHRVEGECGWHPQILCRCRCDPDELWCAAGCKCGLCSLGSPISCRASSRLGLYAWCHGQGCPIAGQNRTLAPEPAVGRTTANHRAFRWPGWAACRVDWGFGAC